MALSVNAQHALKSMGGTAGKEILDAINDVIEMATPGAATDAETLATGEMLAGVITGTQSSGSTNALTLPTGTVMDAALPGTFVADDSFDFTIINLSTTAADTYTLTAAASGFTIVGKAIIDGVHASVFGSGSATFRCRKTAANTFVAYRIS